MSDKIIRCSSAERSSRQGFPASYQGCFSRGCRYGSEYDKHVHAMASRFNEEYEQRREYDRKQEEYLSGKSDVVRIETCNFYPRDNAREHHTEMYELVHSVSSRPIFRRGQVFVMSIKFRDQNFKPDSHNVRLLFTFGSNPSVPKDTKIVLPLTNSQSSHFESGNEWEARIQKIENAALYLKVYVPPDTPVGIWRCSVETCPDGFIRKDQQSDLQDEKRHQNFYDQSYRRDKSFDRHKDYDKRKAHRSTSPYRPEKSSHQKDQRDCSSQYKDRYSYQRDESLSHNKNDERDVSPPYRKDKDLHQREGSPYRKDKDLYHTDGKPHRKDVDSHHREASPYCKDSHSHKRDGSPYCKDSHSHKRDGSPYCKDSHLHKRDDSPYCKDSHSHKRDGSPHYRDSHSHYRKDSPYCKNRDLYQRDGSAYKKGRYAYQRDSSPYQKDRDIHWKDGSPHKMDRDIHQRDKSSSSQDRDSYQKDSSPLEKDKEFYHKDDSSYNKESSGYSGDKDTYKREDSPYRKDRIEGSSHTKDRVSFQRQDSRYGREISAHERDSSHYHKEKDFYKGEISDELDKSHARSDSQQRDVSEHTSKTQTSHCRNFYSSKNERSEIFQCENDIYIVFNPWCRDDPVYMENKVARKEYVLNENGKIWMGSYRRNRGRRWVYGQFDRAVLPAVMCLLEEARMDATERANPIRVVRAVSEMVHNKDYNYELAEKRGNGHQDSSLMIGRWDGNYDDGVCPFSWTGSVGILEQYLCTGKPVKYGQCWVFAAVTTTICRALGIPCRPVTNFVSSHDTSNSLCIDKYFSSNGDQIEGGPDGESWDSVWTFHSWNDAWMARPDLPSGYGGWQAIDSTFQEESDGRYRCGPASLESISRGQVGFCYDTPFLFSELNSEVNHWQEDKASEWGFKRMKNGRYQVGRHILTKRPDRDDDDGDEDVEDIIHEYKPKDGSCYEEVKNAVRGMDKRYHVNKREYEGADDVECEMLDIEKTQIGKPFTVTISIMNRSHEDRTVDAKISCDSIYYTGVKNRKIKQQHGQFVLKPNQRETLTIKVKPEEYQDNMVDHCMIKVYAVANVKETGQAWGEEDDFCFEKPRLNIKTRGRHQVDEHMEVTFSFTNPLNVMLTNCKFSFEGAGIQRPSMVRFRDIKPGETVSHTELLMPRSEGNSRIVANFTSHQLKDVNGNRKVNIEG